MSSAFSRAEAAWLAPPDERVGPCAECGDSMEDHDGTDGLAECQVRGCDCDAGREVTADDWEDDL